MLAAAGGGGGGGDMIQQLMQLAGPILASPQGQAMAQALMQQIGGGGSGGGDPRAMMAQMQGGGGQDMPQGAPQQQAAQPMSTEDELAMAQKGMGGPTQEDIAVLMSDPSPQTMRSFAQKFGREALKEALMMMNGDGDADDAGPPSKRSSQEGEKDYDDEDPGDHEYR